MAYNVEIVDFPTLAVQAQLFYAGGAAYDGGFTSGGARVISPEPGGRAFLEVQLSLQVNEWETPFASWLMTRVNNGTVFRIALTKTPQLLTDAAIGVTPGSGGGNPWAAVGMYPEHNWSNGQPWAKPGAIFTPNDAQEGDTTITVSTDLLRVGHVIGIANSSYLIENINTSDNGTFDLSINPPLRQNILDYDYVLTRPYFLGTVSNASEVRTMYERSNNGHIQPGRLLFAEFIP